MYRYSLKARVRKFINNFMVQSIDFDQREKAMDCII
jgi:hypothetical protein